MHIKVLASFSSRNMIPFDIVCITNFYYGFLHKFIEHVSEAEMNNVYCNPSTSSQHPGTQHPSVTVRALPSFQVHPSFTCSSQPLHRSPAFPVSPNPTRTHAHAQLLSISSPSGSHPLGVCIIIGLSVFLMVMRTMEVNVTENLLHRQGRWDLQK